MNQEFIIIDDDKSSIFLLEIKLKKLGFKNKIHSAANGRAGLDLLKHFENELVNSGEEDNKCFLIFLDINMPIMNGFEFLKNFEEIAKEFKRIKPVVVSMLTSSENPKDIEKSKEFNFVGEYLVKFPDDIQLKGLVDKCFYTQ